MKSNFIEANPVGLIHNKLNEICILAENVFKSIKNELHLEASYGFSSGHYIKINDRYEYQKYPLPIVSIEGKGEIGFNIDEVWLEFFLDKVAFNKVNIESLIIKYRVEIYGGKNCLTDFFTEGKSILDILDDVNNSDEETIGIAIYLKDAPDYMIKEIFLNVCSILKV